MESIRNSGGRRLPPRRRQPTVQSPPVFDQHMHIPQGNYLVGSMPTSPADPSFNPSPDPVSDMVDMPLDFDPTAGPSPNYKAAKEAADAAAAAGSQRREERS